MFEEYIVRVDAESTPPARADQILRVLLAQGVRFYDTHGSEIVITKA